ncbi:MAG: hypothetical protein KDC45_06155 [Bacteroidetes bacterium]|nr:hypothetical protein [Bacteroidota bacterium]
MNACLALLTIFTGLAAVFAVLETYHTFREPGGTLSGVLVLKSVIGLWNLACLIVVWSWRKIGVFGLLAGVVALFGVNLFLGVPLGLSMAGFSGTVVLLILLKPKWTLLT